MLSPFEKPTKNKPAGKFIVSGPYLVGGRLQVAVLGGNDRDADMRAVACMKKAPADMGTLELAERRVMCEGHVYRLYLADRVSARKKKNAQPL